MREQPVQKNTIAAALADVVDVEDSRKNAALAAEIGTALSIEYPGHNWQVYCDIEHGHYHIRNLSLSAKHGMILHPKHLHDLKAMAVDMGGELLERFNISRGRAGVMQAVEFLKQRPAHG